MISMQFRLFRLCDMDRRVPHQGTIAKDPKVLARREGGEEGATRPLSLLLRY